MVCAGSTLKTIAENLVVGNPVSPSIILWPLNSLLFNSLPTISIRDSEHVDISSPLTYITPFCHPPEPAKSQKAKSFWDLCSTRSSPQPHPLILYGLWKYWDRCGDRPQNLGQLANWGRLFCRLMGTSGVWPTTRVGHQPGIESVRCGYRRLRDLPWPIGRGIPPSGEQVRKPFPDVQSRSPMSMWLTLFWL